MRQNFFKQESIVKAYITLDTKKCEACWECLSVCPKNVISRINMPWHKHARISNSSECIGCYKCVKICLANAINRLF